MKQVLFLIPIISKDGIVVESSKVEAVMDCNKPRNVIEVWSFLDLQAIIGD